MARNSWDDPQRTGDDEPASPRRDGAHRYDEADVLGSGASGRIVRALDRRLERDVALKIVTPERPLALARLRREASVLAQLEHPAIVPIYDLLERDDGGLQLALRIVRGRTLDRAMADAPRDARWLEHVLRASQAAACAHARGIVHRDLKPANIMIGEYGETQVIDWGLAKLLDDVTPLDGAEPDEVTPRSARLTRVGAVVGTPAYMAPEQARGAGVDRRADVWALGAMLYEALTGRGLQDAGDDANAMLASLRDGHVPDAEARQRLARCEADARTLALVLSALAHDPDDRPSDAGVFAQRLEAALRPRRATRRWPWLSAAGAIVAVLVIFVLAARPGEPLIADARPATREPPPAPPMQIVTTTPSPRDAQAAMRALAEGHHPEAAALAAEVLADGPSADAYGVLSAIDLSRAPSLAEARTIPGCATPVLAADGGRWLCRDPERVRVFEGDRVAWQQDGASTGAVFSARGARVIIATSGANGDTVLALHDSGSGRLIERGDSGCGGALTSSADGARAYLSRSDCLVVISDTRTHRLTSRMALQITTVGGDGTWAGLVGGGALAVGFYDDYDQGDSIALDVIVANRVVTEQDVVCMVSLPGRRVALGTVAGEVVVVGLDGVVLTRRRFATAGGIQAIAVSPSGETLALALEGGGPLVVDADLRVLARLPRSDGAALALPDDRTLVTLGTRIAHWQLRPPARPELPALPGLSALATDGERLVLAHGKALSWLELADPRAIMRRFEASMPLTSVAIASDGTIIAADVQSPRMLHVGGDPISALADIGPLPASVRGLAVTASGVLLVALHTHELWAAPPARRGQRPEPMAILPAWIDDLAVRGESIVALDTDGDVIALVADPVPRELQRCHDAMAIAVATSPDGEHVYALHRDAIVGYARESCEPTAWLADDTSALGELAVIDASYDGAFVASGARDGRVLIWRSDGGLAARLRFPLERVVALAFDPAGRFLAVGTALGQVRLLDLATLALAPEDATARARAAWAMR